MDNHGRSAPLLPAPTPGPAARLLHWGLDLAAGASLLVSPRPIALLTRKLFARGGARTKAVLDRHAAPGMAVLDDERYGDQADMLLDVVHPDTATGRLPLVLWVHGGGWVGGTKDELRGYFTLLAEDGLVVAAPRYSLAPESQYPTPVQQVMAALEYLQAHAERFHIDPERIVVAGDSAGAQIAAQVAALVTAPEYASRAGIAPTTCPAQLRGAVLACGVYDRILVRTTASSPVAEHLFEAILWAYSGQRHFLDDPASTLWSVTDNVTADFPPTLVTVGNADPLRPHSERLVEVLRAHGAEPETVFWSRGHEPSLGHEYQFDLDLDEAQHFLATVRRFLQRHLGT